MRAGDDVIVQWFVGVLVNWCAGVLVYWCAGVLVQWTTKVSRYTGGGAPCSRG